MSIRKYGRYWALYDDAGALVCICLYKKGEAEVFRRLQQLPAPPVSPTHTHHKARLRSQRCNLGQQRCCLSAPRPAQRQHNQLSHR
jgi:hypothetical protein